MAKKIYTAFDLPPEVVQAILEAYDSGRGLFTFKAWEDNLAKLRTSLSAPPDVRTYLSDNAGALSFKRTERLMYGVVKDQGGTGVATVQTISGEGWANFDLLHLRTDSNAVTVRLTSGGNVYTNGSAALELTGPEQFVVLTYIAGSFYECFRYPYIGTEHLVDAILEFVPETVTVSAGTLTLTKSLAYVLGEPTAEVLANGSFLVDQTPGNATISMVSLTNSGNILLGTLDVVSLGEEEAAAGCAEAVNALTESHGYTAEVFDEFSVRINCPVGTGESGNGFTLQVISSDTSAVEISNVTGFSGGSSGSQASDTITTIAGMQPGQMAIILCWMDPQTITLASGGNIALSSNIVLNPGQMAILLYTTAGYVMVMPDVSRRALPTGGTTGQVLSKIDAADFNVQWVDQTGGGGSGWVPPLYSIRDYVAPTTSNSATMTTGIGPGWGWELVGDAGQSYISAALDLGPNYDGSDLKFRLMFTIGDSPATNYDTVVLGITYAIVENDDNINDPATSLYVAQAIELASIGAERDLMIDFTMSKTMTGKGHASAHALLMVEIRRNADDESDDFGDSIYLHSIRIITA